MRKLTILLAVAALVASNGCCGRCRNWFSKGSPCGTTMAMPAALSAPLALGAPMAGPVMQPQFCVEQQPAAMCMPCVPCCDPCDPCGGTMGMGMTTGYMGGYMQGADCACDGASSTMLPAGSVPAAGMVMPQPLN